MSDQMHRKVEISSQSSTQRGAAGNRHKRHLSVVKTQTATTRLFLSADRFIGPDLLSPVVVMADSEAKGQQYMEDAKKKLSSSKGFLGGLFG